MKKRDVKIRIGAGIAAFALVAGIIASVVAPLAGDGDPAPSDSGESITTATLTDNDYADMVASLRGLIESAQGDRCELASAIQAIATLPMPINDTETRARVDVTAELLGATADSMAEEDPQGAEVFDQAAADLISEAEANNYSLSWFTTELDALNSEAFNETYRNYAAATREQCEFDTSGTTTAPA